MRRRTLLTLIVLVAFAAFLTYTTLSAQRYTCDVCVNHNGGRNCASASHESEAEARMAATTTACGPLVRGMNEAIACQNRDVVSASCRTK